VSTTLVLVVVLVFSFVASRLLMRLRRTLVLPTAGIYAFVGLALGPFGLAVVDREMLLRLQPVLFLLLGALGFIMGLSLRRTFSETRGLEAGLLSGSLVVAGVGGVALLLLRWLLGGGWTALWPALAIGAIAAVSDGQLFGYIADRAGARGPIRELAQTLAVASSIVAVAVLGLSLALLRARASAGELQVTPTEWLLAALGAGVACGVLFALFVGRWGNDQRAFLATVAIIVYASGIASAIGVSPLFAGMIAGLTVSVASAQAPVVARALARIEEPAVVGVVLLAGAWWSPPAPLLWGVVAVCLVVRFVAVRVGVAVGSALFPALPRTPRLGNVLLPQGGLAAALAVSFAQVVPEHGPVVLTIALIGLLLSDAAGYPTVRQVLADAGEIVHRAVPAEAGRS
jgi:hypothetical protein